MLPIPSNYSHHILFIKFLSYAGDVLVIMVHPMVVTSVLYFGHFITSVAYLCHVLIASLLHPDYFHVMS